MVYIKNQSLHFFPTHQHLGRASGKPLLRVTNHDTSGRECTLGRDRVAGLPQPLTSVIPRRASSSPAEAAKS